MLLHFRIQAYSLAGSSALSYSVFLLFYDAMIFLKGAATIQRVRDYRYAWTGSSKVKLEVLSIECDIFLHSLKLKCVCATKFLIVTIRRSCRLWVYKHSWKWPLVCYKM